MAIVRLKKRLTKPNPLIPPTQGLCAEQCEAPLCLDPRVGCLNQPAYALREMVREGCDVKVSDKPDTKPIANQVHTLHIKSYQPVQSYDITYTLWYMYKDMEFYHLDMVYMDLGMDVYSDSLYDEAIELIQQHHDIVIYTSNISQYASRHTQSVNHK